MARPKRSAGVEMYVLAKDLLHVENIDAALSWTQRITDWRIKYNGFLGEMIRDEKGTLRPTHERLLKAENSLVRLVKSNTLFTYLNESIGDEAITIPATNTV